MEDDGIPSRKEPDFSTISDISVDKDSPPVQPQLSSYPKRSFASQTRSFNPTWYKTFKFLEYSEAHDQAYCFVCRNFSNKKSSFTSGYANWINGARDVKYHWSTPDHEFSVQKHAAYIASKIRGPVSTQINSQCRETVLRNRRVVATHVEILLLCAKQEIALRGHREDAASKNRGNFLAIAEYTKKKCPDHATDVARLPKNAQYTHHEIQNELLEISASLLLRQIQVQVQGSSCFAIIADETRDTSGTEQLSLCVRYVEGNGVIERFVGFAELEKMDASAITDAILGLIKQCGLEIRHCVAQSYDGAAVMSGSVAGVRQRIQSLTGGACPYVHCHAHRLNLVLVHCCSRIRPVRDLLGLLQSLYAFQSNSSKRATYFEEAQKRLDQPVLKMPQSCDTRWFSKRKGISYFKNRLQSSITALENIVENGAPDEIVQCKGYVRELRSFQTVLLLVILDKILGEVNTLSEYLQCSTMIYTKALELSQATVDSLKHMRCERTFGGLWREATELAAQAHIEMPVGNSEPEPKRRKIASKKLENSIPLSSTGHNETSGNSPYASNKILFFEILDNFCCEISRRLLENDEIYELLATSDPRSEDFLNEERVEKLCEEFPRFEIDPLAIKSELSVARNLLRSAKVKSASECLSYLLPLAVGFEHLIKFYKLVLAFPVASASCERSFSALKRIKTYLRATMGEKRTSALAVLSINGDLADDLYDNPDLVVDEFAKRADRRLAFTL